MTLMTSICFLNTGTSVLTSAITSRFFTPLSVEAFPAFTLPGITNPIHLTILTSDVIIIYWFFTSAIQIGGPAVTACLLALIHGTIVLLYIPADALCPPMSVLIPRGISACVVARAECDDNTCPVFTGHVIARVCQRIVMRTEDRF